MVELIFAIRRRKEEMVVDARNPSRWEEVGTVIMSDNYTWDDVVKERKLANIPDDALVVNIRSLS